MDNLEAQPERVVFSHFEVNLRSGELRKNGRKVRIQSLPFQLLTVLMERPNEVVTREELSRRLWPGDTFVDFEHSIGTAINKLRGALGDSAAEPRYVETLPRRGYRFIGEIKAPSTTGTWSGNQDDLRVPEIVARNNGDRAIPAPAVWVGWARGRTLQLGTAFVLLLLLALVWRGLHRAPAAANGPAPIRSIAVLPMENLSGDTSQDYFAEGMTDQLITTLAKNRGLRITSRASTMHYKGTHGPVGEIARKLGVEGVVLGSVVRSGNRVRINAQLVRASDESNIWSESYDRDFGDALSLEEDVAHAISEQVRVSSAPVTSGAPPAHTNPAAYEAYLQGEYYWHRGQQLRSREFFEKAIDNDPSFALGYAGLADSYLDGPKPDVPEGEAALRKALELDPLLAQAHVSLAADEFFFHRNWDRALAEGKRATELNPSLAEAHHVYSYALSIQNRVGEALEQERIAQQLDPLARPWGLGRAYLRLRQYDDAIRELRSQIGIYPEMQSLHYLLAEAYDLKGMPEAAFAEFQRAMELDGNGKTEAAARAWEASGMRGLAELQLANLKKSAPDVELNALADANAWAGHRDDAIHYLQLELRERDPNLVWLKQNPHFDWLRSDTDFQTIVSSVGLP